MSSLVIDHVCPRDDILRPMFCKTTECGPSRNQALILVEPPPAKLGLLQALPES